MNLSPVTREKIIKLFNMMDSTFEREAVVALKKVRSALDSEGLTIGKFIDGLQESDDKEAIRELEDECDVYETIIQKLEAEIEELKTTKLGTKKKSDFETLAAPLFGNGRGWQAKCAEYLGVSTSAVSQWIHGHKSVSYVYMKKLKELKEMGV